MSTELSGVTSVIVDWRSALAKSTHNLAERGLDPNTS